VYIVCVYNRGCCFVLECEERNRYVFGFAARRGAIITFMPFAF
jgi:hypothetical protein